MEAPTYAKTLARYVTHISFADLPERVVEHTKLCITDTLGIALASPVIEGSTEFILDFVKKLKGKEEASLFKYHDKVPCTNAILANSYLAHCIGFDDTHNEAIAHTGAGVIPTAIATAEREGKDGKDVITAVVLGYDIAVRVSMALNPVMMYARGFHPSSICVTFGCAAAAGKLLNLNEDQVINAFGLAGVQAAGLLAGMKEGSTSFLLQYSKAAQSGFLSAELAQCGLTGWNMILEDEKGFGKAFSEKPDLTKLTNLLGKKFEIIKNTIKLYPCCHFMHAGIDALREIMHVYSVKAKDLERITLKLPSKGLIALEVDRHVMPENRRSARVNAPYIMSVAAIGGDAILDINKLIEEKRNDQKIQRFLPRVEVVADSELDKFLPKKRVAIVEVETKDGKRHTHRVDVPKGDPGNALTKDEVNGKFRKLTQNVLSRKRIEELLEIINKLEQVDNIPQLTKLLRV